MVVMGTASGVSKCNPQSRSKFTRFRMNSQVLPPFSSPHSPTVPVSVSWLGKGASAQSRPRNPCNPRHFAGTPFRLGPCQTQAVRGRSHNTPRRASNCGKTTTGCLSSTQRRRWAWARLASPTLGHAVAADPHVSRFHRQPGP